MKIYSILIMSLTLVLFYNLAVFQQNKLDRSELKPIGFEKKTDQFKKHAAIVPYVHIEDEFSMQVTGKEHRYLNTGISFIEDAEAAQKKQCIVAVANEQKTNLTGS